MDIRYTKDNRKVALLSEIAGGNYLVKEVFVKEDGTEYLDGKEFIVNELFIEHGALSWRDSAIRTIESEYSSLRRDLEYKIREQKREYITQLNAVKNKAAWLKNVAREPHCDTIKNIIHTLYKFLSGETMWVVREEWGDYKIEPFLLSEYNGLLDENCPIDQSYNRDWGRKMKILSLFGNYEGGLSWEIHQEQNNGCGWSIRFFDTKEEAIRYIQESIDSLDRYNDSVIKNIKEFGLKPNPVLLRDYIDKLHKEKSQKRDGLLKAVNKLDAEMGELKNKYWKVEE